MQSSDLPITYGFYASCVGAFCIFSMVYLLVKQRTGGTLKTWLASGISGAVLGICLLLLVGKVRGYVWAPAPVEPGVTTAEYEAESNSGGGGPRGGGGPGGGGGRGGFQPSPARELAAWVAKANLLVEGVKVDLDAGQKEALHALLEGIQKEAQIQDENAAEMLEALNAKLTEEQLAVLAKVSLPRTRGPRGGGGGDQPANPFQEGAGAEAMKGLLGQLSQK